jgi:hypothetical protein
LLGLSFIWSGPGDEVRKGGQTPMSEHSTKDRASFQELVC